MVSTTNTIANITNHQLLTIKTIKNYFLKCALRLISLGFSAKATNKRWQITNTEKIILHFFKVSGHKQFILALFN